MAVDTIYLKNEQGVDIPYQIGADSRNVTYSPNAETVEGSVHKELQQNNIHKNTIIANNAGVHGLRYTDNKLQVQAPGGGWTPIDFGTGDMKKEDYDDPNQDGVISIAHGGTGNTSGYVRVGAKSGSNIGTGSTAEGGETKASGDYAHAEGNQTEANHICTHAEGLKTKASGDYAHAEGNQTEATSQAAHAEGIETKARGQGAHAEGRNTIAERDSSHAEGERTTASESSAHAEGYYTTAEGRYSHAEGEHTTAKGKNSHAQGYYTEARGENSFASGESTKVYGKSSFALGNHSEVGDSNSATNETGMNTFVGGKYIKTTGNNSFLFGDGGTTGTTDFKHNNQFAFIQDGNSGKKFGIDGTRTMFGSVLNQESITYVGQPCNVQYGGYFEITPESDTHSGTFNLEGCAMYFIVVGLQKSDSQGSSHETHNLNYIVVNRYDSTGSPVITPLNTDNNITSSDFSLTLTSSSQPSVHQNVGYYHSASIHIIRLA